MNKPNQLRLFFLSILLLTSSISIFAEEDPWSQSYKLEAQGNYTEAANKILPFVNNGIKSEFAMLRLAWLAYLSKDYNESVKRYQDAIAFNANSLDARLGLLLPLMAQSRWREATLHAEQVLAVAPWQYYAHVRLMACEAAQQQWEKLQKHAKVVAERYPTDGDSLVFLARAQAKLNNPAAAKNTYKKVLELYPENIEALQFIVRN